MVRKPKTRQLSGEAENSNAGSLTAEHTLTAKFTVAVYHVNLEVQLLLWCYKKTRGFAPTQSGPRLTASRAGPFPSPRIS